jgi:hypothetical protein
MLLQILTHTPVFVWFLLAGLIVLGWRQSRDRLVAPLQVLALPALMLGLGGWSLAPGMAALPVVALAWLGALALGAAAGARTPQLPGTAWLAPSGRFRVPGSWVPMGFILVIFTLRYSSNVAFVMHPEWRGMLAVQATLAVVLGLVSGLAIGRAIGLLRLMRPVWPATRTMATHA